MFGSEIVAGVLYHDLAALPEAAAFAGMIFNLPVVPQNAPAAFVLFAPEFSAYTDPLGGGARQPGGITYEQLRFSIRVICAGASTAPIAALALAQLKHFDSLITTTTANGISYQMVFMAQGEVPITTLVDGSNLYRQLGTVYTVELITGG